MGPILPGYFRPVANRATLQGTRLCDNPGGAFAFATGLPSLPSFRFFLERNEWMAPLPDQQVSQAEVWDRLGVELAAEQTAPSSKGSRACRCSQKLARASTRVGLGSKLLEAAPD